MAVELGLDESFALTITNTFSPHMHRGNTSLFPSHSASQHGRNAPQTTQPASKAHAAENYIWCSVLLKPLKPANRHDSCTGTVSMLCAHSSEMRDSASRLGWSNNPLGSSSVIAAAAAYARPDIANGLGLGTSRPTHRRRMQQGAENAQE